VQHKMLIQCRVWVAAPEPSDQRTTPAMVDAQLFLPGLSPVQGKAVIARFDGGRLSSQGGLLALREIERRLGLTDRLAACLRDPRMSEKVVHQLVEIIRFRMLMIAAGYEDGNDADTLRADPMFKLAIDRVPSGEELCSRALLWLVPRRSQAHRARYRRHLRPGARQPAAAAVQCLSSMKH
jgi:Transposase DDE domain group 1